MLFKNLNNNTLNNVFWNSKILNSVLKVYHAYRPVCVTIYHLFLKLSSGVPLDQNGFLFLKRNTKLVWFNKEPFWFSALKTCFENFGNFVYFFKFLRVYLKIKRDGSRFQHHL